MIRIKNYKTSIIKWMISLINLIYFKLYKTSLAHIIYMYIFVKLFINDCWIILYLLKKI